MKKNRRSAPIPRPGIPEQALYAALQAHPDTRHFRYQKLWSTLPEGAVYRQEHHLQPEAALAHCQQLAQQHQLLVSPSIHEPQPLRWTLLRLMRQLNGVHC